MAVKVLGKEMYSNKYYFLPIQRVSSDHHKSKLPVNLNHCKGRIDVRDVLSGGYIFLYHASGDLYEINQVE